MKSVQKEPDTRIRTRVILHKSRGKEHEYHSSFSVYLHPDEVQALILSAFERERKTAKGKGASRPFFKLPLRRSFRRYSHSNGV